MFAPDLEGFQKEPPPKRFNFANEIDHKACGGLLQDLPRMLREVSNHDAAMNEVAQVLHQGATAMERTAELLRTHLNTPALFVSPPGILYWGECSSSLCICLQKSASPETLNFICPRLTCALGNLTCDLKRSRRTPT